MVTVSLWVGFGVTMATHGANPHGNSIPVGGAKGHHSYKMGRADFYGNSIQVGGTWGYHGNTCSQSHGNSIPVGGTKGSHGNTKGAEPIPW